MMMTGSDSTGWRLIEQGNGFVLDTGCCQLSCLAGRSGLVPAEMKTEGDGATPKGTWRLRCLYYRPDRLSLSAIAPPAHLLCRALRADDGWCDDPESPLYNCPVRLPFSGRHERLWRDDGLYDLILPLGYNDSPPVPHRGSAIFLHCALAHSRHTQGCLALPRAGLLSLVQKLQTYTTVTI